MSEESDKPFIRATKNGRKVKCVTCGQIGWGPEDPTLQTAFPWQLKCLQGHPFKCACGRAFATLQQRRLHQRSCTAQEAVPS